MDRKLQRHRADSLRQHGFLVLTVTSVKSATGVEVKFKNVHYPVIIAATHIKELNVIQQIDTGLRVGASVTMTTLDQTLKQTIRQLSGNVSTLLICVKIVIFYGRRYFALYFTL